MTPTAGSKQQSMEKDFFISAINLAEIGDASTFPTALLYLPDDSFVVGRAALDKARSIDDLNLNFKIALGNIIPGGSAYRRERFATAVGQEKSAYELTKDFIEKVLLQLRQYLRSIGHEVAGKIMVAEPLAFYTDETKSEWLPNFRNNMKRILEPHFKTIEFLPEPFAVFQFYKYGSKHPYLGERKRFNALVIDFGGGTFDVSVVRTTKEGDVKRGGKHSQPIGAVSEPIGGFYLNERISEALLVSLLRTKEEKTKANKAINQFKRWRENKIDIEELNQQSQNFIKNLHAMTFAVEPFKIGLCQLIHSWQLEDRNDGAAVAVSVCANPFEIESEKTTLRLSKGDLLKIFEEEIWNRRLKNVVRKVLKRSEEGLEGEPVSVVLLSGGSSNIGWLPHLIERDFAEELSQARVVQIGDDYQQVVAKGLAVECVRRMHDPNSEFRSVTYNSIYLMVNPDDKGVEVPEYRPLTEEIAKRQLSRGQLLSSASAVQDFFNKPIRWRFKLSTTPRYCLEYYFMKDTLDPDDVMARYNVDNRLFTPKEVSYGKYMVLEVTVQENGTCTPKLIYKAATDKTPEYCKEGKPFALDMTYSCADESGGGVYLGFDFGSSNSAISYVERDAIRVIEARATNKSFTGLADCIAAIPHPIAIPLGKYIGESIDPRLVDDAVDVTEAVLSVAAFVACAEAFAKGKGGGLFKGFAKRSMGPLRQLLENSLKALGGKARFSNAFSDLVHKRGPEVASFIDELNLYRHHKQRPETINHNRAIRTMINICHNASQQFVFGYFEGVKSIGIRRKGFGGIFREAHGINRPFLRMYDYEGADAFQDYAPYVVDVNAGAALELAPFFWWKPASIYETGGELLIFDNYDKGATSYKYANGSEFEQLSAGEERGGVYKELEEMAGEMKEVGEDYREFRELSFRLRECR
jgi:hypothetical protein